jgi:hypothetical protein
MSEKIWLLKASIQESIHKIEEAYLSLGRVELANLDADRSIIVSYYLHVIYGHFENLFTRIASAFENQIEDKSQWHSELLWRMTINIQGIRPAVISKESQLYLDELRRFRHLFRNAYLLRFDPDRLALVLRDARHLEARYQSELADFIAFLDVLLEEDH